MIGLIIQGFDRFAQRVQFLDKNGLDWFVQCIYCLVGRI